MILGFTVSALITPKVLGVETSLEGLAKLDRFSTLNTYHQKMRLMRSARGVLLMKAMSPTRWSGPRRIFLPRLPNIVPPQVGLPPETGYWPSISPPSEIQGAGTNALVLRNSFTRLLTLPFRPASASVAPGAKLPVVYKVAGPNSVPAALSMMLKGSPDCRVAIPEMLQPSPSFRMASLVACSGPGRFHVPLIASRCVRSKSDTPR